jgi:hypothetical protein
MMEGLLMTRSKELRRIEAAIEHPNAAELRWALAECELRKRFRTGHSDRWDRLEQQIRAALDSLNERE